MVAARVTLTSNLAAKVKRVSLNGRSYLVAPASLIVPGVLNGSDGALYYPPEEVSRNASAWDGVPLVVYHPLTENGEPTSALNEYGRVDRKVYERVGVGALRNTRYDGRRLVAEAWFDEEHTRNHDAKLQAHAKILPRLNAEQAIELSTGLHVERDEKPGVCPTTNRPYSSSTSNYRPDHLAVLPDQRGACSVQDGCGVVVNAEESEGKWVTLPNGVHIMVKDGEIVHGPENLKSRNRRVRERLTRSWTRRPRSNKTHKFPHGPKILEGKEESTESAKFTENAGKYGNPQCGDTGQFLAHGSGTGKGDTHAAAKEGRHGPKTTENDCAGGIAENCSMTSKVMNSNPEGHNQYTKGLSDHANRMSEQAKDKASHKEAQKAHEAAQEAHQMASESALEKGDYNSAQFHHHSSGTHAIKSTEHYRATEGLKDDSFKSGSFGSARRQASTRQIKADEGRIPKRNRQGDSTMALKPEERTSLLTKLVTNCKCSGEDQKVLNTLSDDALVRVANAFPMKRMTDKEKADEEDMEDGGDDEESENPDGSKKKGKVPPQFAKNQRKEQVTVNAEIKTPTFEQLLEAAPPAYRAVWNTAVKVEHRERKELLTKLVANVAKDKQEATWNAFKDEPIDRLQAIVDLIPAPQPVANKNALPFSPFPSFAGASGFSPDGVTNNEQGSEELLDIPTINWAEKASA